ncbi:hypothetical protein E2C01_025806 [Portunus trituberculatus]|uniref:RNase H type-1 domain-containing protein n=1 Tax=Portunus trituberculatus TaxID=210409 RepID=A0A5B7EGI0_PORTR|nr:hypothetical protein [Portunus trituberculatus]
MSSNTRSACTEGDPDRGGVRVHTHKYLGVQLSFKKALQAVHYVQDMSAVIGTTSAASKQGPGQASIPILRIFYSLIDYAVPILIQFSATQLCLVELVQHEAMKIILGCPRIAQIEVHRGTAPAKYYVIHVYCDGSINGTRSGFGLFICNYIFPNHYIDTEVPRQLPEHLSSTRAELYTVVEVLHIVAPLYKDVYFFVDSQTTLYALQSTSPMDYYFVNNCLGLIHTLEGAGAMVHFTWIRSHVGVSSLTKRQTTLFSLPFRMTQWMLALRTL